MTPIKEIGECVISVGDEDYLFRPSLINMTKIGSPQEIVQKVADLHNTEVQELIAGMWSATGRLPDWFMKYLNNSNPARRAFSAAIDVLQACCESDLSPLIGDIVPGRTGKRAFVWKQGKMALQDMLLIASSLITHGVIGKAKVRQLQRNESRGTTSEFKAVDYINAARNHFSMTRTEAENLTMTEFILMLNQKYPEQKGFTREEYDQVVDDYFAMKEKRLNG